METSPVVLVPWGISVVDLNVTFVYKGVAATLTYAFFAHQRPQHLDERVVIHLCPEELSRHPGLMSSFLSTPSNDCQWPVGILLFVTLFLLAVATYGIEMPNRTVWHFSPAAGESRVVLP